MKYAEQVDEMINAFSPEPLRREQMAEFYCADTMEYRTSDKYDSPIEDIFDFCLQSGKNGAFLLLGHRGCGKSTELNCLSARFMERGYEVKTITCSRDLDLLNIVYSDLFILMGEALLEIVQETGCRIDRSLLCDIESFWDEGTKTVVSREINEASAESGLSMETPGILSNILRAFAGIKADLKYNEETRKEYHKKMTRDSGKWIRMMGRISEEICKKTEGKHPIIIFEDLDKLNPEDAWTVFYNYAATLSGMVFPVIYTFPIGLSYDARFSAMESYFQIKTLPMIKIENIDGQPFEQGIEVIREIVRKRADLELFAEGVLDTLIRYTGGSLRDLFHVINAAAKRAERRNSRTIDREDAQRALEELKTSLTRRIEEGEYEFLLNIYRGNKERIQDKGMLLKMLQASVVLEYNGKRWHNVHPLIVRFFKEQGLIADEE